MSLLDDEEFATKTVENYHRALSDQEALHRALEALVESIPRVRTARNPYRLASVRGAQALLTAHQEKTSRSGHYPLWQLAELAKVYLDIEPCPVCAGPVVVGCTCEWCK